MTNDWDTPIRELAIVPPGLPEAPRSAVRSGDAAALIARADKYLNTGSGEYASEIMRDMATFIRRLPASAQVAWMPIETAPKDGTKIDLWMDGCRAPNCFWRDDNWAWLDSWKPNKHGAKTRFIPVYKSYSNIEPTHWMPAPKGPVVPSAKQNGRAE